MVELDKYDLRVGQGVFTKNGIDLENSDVLKELQEKTELQKTVFSNEDEIKKLTIEKEMLRKGVAEIMENVDDDGWAYAWCSKALKQ